MTMLTFNVTDKCNIKCDFCAVGSGPSINGNLKFEEMTNIYEQLHRLSKVGLVVFTGGEPLLYQDEIYQTLDFISRKQDKPAIRIVTNAYWANSFEKARETLEKLKEVGLTEVNYSVDDFHQEFIPLERIKNAVEAALDLNISVLLAHKSYPESVSNKTTYEKLLGREIPHLKEISSESFFEEPLTFSSGYTVPVGRGSERVNKSQWFPEDYSKDNWKGPCSSVFNSVNISSKGHLVPCCGLVDRNVPVFYSGNVLENNLEDVIEKANKNILYNWLALEGPSSIMEFVKEVDSSIHFEERYVQNCQLCQELFSNDKVISIIADNLDVIGQKVGLVRSLFDATRQVEFSKVLKQLKSS